MLLFVLCGDMMYDMRMAIYMLYVVTRMHAICVPIRSLMMCASTYISGDMLTESRMAKARWSVSKLFYLRDRMGDEVGGCYVRIFSLDEW